MVKSMHNGLDLGSFILDKRGVSNTVTLNVVCSAKRMKCSAREFLTTHSGNFTLPKGMRSVGNENLPRRPNLPNKKEHGKR